MFASAKTIHFQEEKYIEALDNDFYKKGTLEFQNNSIKLQYNNLDKILIYKDDTLTLLENNQEQQIDQNSTIMLKMVFLLISSIYYDDIENLEEFFEVVSQEKSTLLIPKKDISRYIKSIHFSKDTKLNYIIISMQNGNTTTIKQIDE
jgi:hypothetical protein